MWIGVLEAIKDPNQPEGRPGRSLYISKISLAPRNLKITFKPTKSIQSLSSSASVEVMKKEEQESDSEHPQEVFKGYILCECDEFNHSRLLDL